MKNKILTYSVILMTGIIIGAGIFYLFNGNGSENAMDQSVEQQLYSCGMHPEIVEKEPGTCPICGMNLTPIKNNNKSVKSGERKIIYWRAPMNPNEIYDAPGKSKMGMDLVPVYEDEGTEQGLVTVSGSVIQSMNIKLSQVEERIFAKEIMTNGILTTDERNEYILNSKLSGWIQKLYVNYVGQEVDKGQKLAEIYSPELVAAQQELITALNFDNSISSLDSGELVKNAVRKLELYDISKSEIDEIISSKKVNKYLPLYAPISGTVMSKDVIEGEKISPNKQLMKIADLNNLWLKADIYESDLPNVKIGTEAEINFKYLPEKTYKGKIKFIYPTVDPISRTITVRIDIRNVGKELKPQMFANVTFKSAGGNSIPALPESAIIRSGKSNLVVKSLGEGKFKPVEVSLGKYSNGFYQVLSGLKLNDKIVTSGQFMLDSESKLRSAVNLYSTPDSEKNNDEKSKEKHEHNSNSIIHEGVIDFDKIDQNKDGKVFQDPMDWNVISDVDGRCPICNMFLKEVTIEEAKINLKANGFDYK